jgi:hypothetical protein
VDNGHVVFIFLILRGGGVYEEPILDCGVLSKLYPMHCHTNTVTVSAPTSPFRFNQLMHTHNRTISISL